MKAESRLPDCLNTSEFMWHVVSNTPRIMHDVRGTVNVDAHIRIDAEGRVAVKSVRCNTLSGRSVTADNEEIVAAARLALSILRFSPAIENGVAVPFDDYPLSFAYTTNALELKTASTERIRSQRMKN